MNIQCRGFVLLAGMSGILTSVAVSEPNDGDFRSKQNGSWGSYLTWDRYDAKNALVGGPGWEPTSPGQIPGFSNLATIREGHAVFTSSVGRLIGTLILEDSATVPGKLEIRSTGIGSTQSVTVYAALLMENSLANPGEIFFSDTGTAGVVGKLIANTNITIAGKIRSQAAVRGGSIETLGSSVLTIGPSAVVEASAGPLTLTGNIEMDGTVRANGPYLLTVSGAPRSGSSGKWEVTNASAVLRFNTTSALTMDSSAGYILLEAGTLDIDQTFTYSGGFKQTGGTIDVAAGKTLTVSGRYFGN